MTRARVVLPAAAAWAGLLVAGCWASGAPLLDEDGYYYLTIARNLAAGRGSTFDGLHPTSGYHPLWMLGLAGLDVVVPASRALFAVTAVQGLLVAAGAVLLVRALRRPLGAAAGLLGGLAWLALMLPAALGGLELALHAALVIACAARWLQGDRGPVLGVLLALAVLARLDALILAATLTLAAAAVGGMRPAAAVGTPTAVVVAGYAAVNRAVFGHALPVSAAAKRLWSRALLERDPAFAAGGWAWAKLQNALWPLRHLDSAWVLGLLLGTIGAAALSLTPAGRATRALRPFVLAAAIQVAAYVLGQHGELTWARWYYALPPLLAAAALADALRFAADRLRSDRRRALLGAAACAAVAVATAWGLARWTRVETERATRRPLLEAAAWARTLPADARIGAWNAGTLGYLSGHPVVNLDGLVNSWSFLESERHDLCGYWERAGLTHLVDAFDEGTGTPVVVPVVLAPDYAACAGRLVRVWEDGPTGRPWRVRAYRIEGR